MLYPKCPTCKELFANKEIVIEAEMDKICNNPDITTEEAEKLKTELILGFGLDYCCNQRLLTYRRLILIVK